MAKSNDIPKPEDIAQIVDTVARLYEALENYRESDEKPGRNLLLLAINQKITTALFSSLRDIEFIEDILLKLIEKRLLKTADKIEGRNTSSAIIITHTQLNASNGISSAGVNSVYIVSEVSPCEYVFCRVNHEKRILALTPLEKTAITQKVRLDVDDGTVDTASIFTPAEMARKIREHMMEGRAVNFAIEAWFEDPEA